EPALRLRLRIGDIDRRVELESSVGGRAVLSGEATSHLALGAGAFAYWGAFGIGMRYVRGFGDTGLRDAVFLATERASPLDVEPRYSGGRGQKTPRVGLGLHAIVTGWGFSKHLGPLLPGFALELPVSFGGPIALVARYDVLWFPGVDASAIVAQTVLAGPEYMRFGSWPIGAGALKIGRA